ncbi:hypothetical protein L228DRAFT_89492 [Xylona heveae TC161]|uniref:Uncharacterized protein n=1 Tax=Xylona heveae (strain CBS 132557 / TC161) TaxID=1328760 RepID=A0A165HYS2_XYLHT|nr:hypothetical protein L228DRAFT_89492 [Xylona heveae TC161]KZF24110.1 hypothetical protein L228DRAFT_89492 [Xylona heveae TC161]
MSLGERNVFAVARKFLKACNIPGELSGENTNHARLSQILKDYPRLRNDKSNASHPSQEQRNGTEGAFRHEGSFTHLLHLAKLDEEPCIRQRIRNARGNKGTMINNHLGNLDFQIREREYAASQRKLKGITGTRKRRQSAMGGNDSDGDSEGRYKGTINEASGSGGSMQQIRLPVKRLRK